MQNTFTQRVEMIESNNLKEVLKILGFKPKDSNTIPHSSPAQPITQPATQPNNTQVLSDELNRGGGRTRLYRVYKA